MAGGTLLVSVVPAEPWEARRLGVKVVLEGFIRLTPGAEPEPDFSFSISAWFMSGCVGEGCFGCLSGTDGAPCWCDGATDGSLTPTEGTPVVPGLEPAACVPVSGPLCRRCSRRWRCCEDSAVEGAPVAPAAAAVGFLSPPDRCRLSMLSRL